MIPLSMLPRLSSPGVPEIQTNVFFGGGGSFQLIHIDDLSCTGNETTLLDCKHADIEDLDCGHPEDIGVICQRSQGIEMITNSFCTINT